MAHVGFRAGFLLPGIAMLINVSRSIASAKSGRAWLGNNFSVALMVAISIAPVISGG